MTLLDLAPGTDATITAISADTCSEERLYAIGICVGSTITKVHDSTARSTQPICVSTQSRSMFAISRLLAGQITISLTKEHA